MSDPLDTLRAYQQRRCGGEGPMLDPVAMAYHRLVDSLDKKIPAEQAQRRAKNNCGEESQRKDDNISA